MKDDKLYLIHISECIERIESYSRKGREHFFETPMVQDAIPRNFEIIGEASKHISSKLKKSHPDLPWKEIAGFRDVLIHDYMGINIEEVWSVVEKHLPHLKQKIEAITRELK